MSQVKLNVAVVKEISPATVTVELSLVEAIALRDLLYCGVVASHPLVCEYRTTSLCNALMDTIPVDQYKRQWRVSSGDVLELEKIHD